MKVILLSVLSMVICCLGAVAQNNAYTQKIKGTIIDADSKNPLAGATVALTTANKTTIANADGTFTFEDVSIGKHTLVISYIGYENRTVADINVTSGKEVILNITITEKIRTKQDVATVTATRNKAKALNEFASVSARSFSMEDAKRYPAATFDPGRMAQNFAGVSTNGDGSNEIIVRGNSPKGVLWRLEGLEIANPNHFASLGGSGGAISMISSNTMGNSDFYTGAFPAEYGNATAGVFDINFRNGNKDKSEFTAMMGILGLEFAAEGPFKKGKKSSYLVNYRYSTLSLLGKIIDLGGTTPPKYQDFSYKLNFPYGKKNNFSIYGIIGYDGSKNIAVKDSTKWRDEKTPNFNQAYTYNYNVTGLSNQFFLNDKSYIKIGTTFNYGLNKGSSDTLNPRNNYAPVITGTEYNKDIAYRANLLYNNKMNSQHTIRAGFILSNLAFNYRNNYFDNADKKLKEFLKAKGSANYMQAYIQWKYRINNAFTLNAGLHSSYLALNKTKSIEPRFSITYKASKNQTISFATALVARPEALSTYFVEETLVNNTRNTPNKNLEMQKAIHYVLNYERQLPKGIRFKTEFYYQYLYDVPVAKKAGSGFSILNAANFYEIAGEDKLVNTGTGKNYGVDISLEKSFSKGFYFIGSGSLFQSKYTNYDKNEFNTAFNRNYQLNLIAGKEWKLDLKGKRTVGFSGKVLTSGGLKESVIDVASSRALNKTMYVANQFFTQATTPYFRSDISISYKRNKKHHTRTIMLDIQNVTGRENVFSSYFDTETGTVKKFYQLKLVPFINYRIEF